MRHTLAAVTLLLPSLFSLLTASAAAQNGAAGLFTAHGSARANGRFGMLLRQFRAHEPALAERHEAGRKDALPVYQHARDIPAGHWVWQRPYWFVFRDGPGDQPPQRNWGPEAACGAPNTPKPGDHGTAWATEGQDLKGEWLLLEYDAVVRATAIEIHETYNPGAVAAVAILTAKGEELELWRNRDVKAVKEKGRVLQIDLPIGFEIERVKLYFNCDAVPGWNEIDAVGLHDNKNNVHWASRAAASSSFADSAAGGVGPAGGRVVANRFMLVQALQNNRLQRLAIQPLQFQMQMPRVVLQAPQLQVIANAALRQPVLINGVAGVRDRADKADQDDNARMQRRIAELEAKVKMLQAALERAKAGK